MNSVTDNELFRSVFQASQEIGKRFYGSTWPMRNDLNVYQAPYELNFIRVNALNDLQADIAGALERADDMQAARDMIEEIIDHTDNPAVIRQYVSIDAAWRDAEIRRDWASALRAVRHGEDLSRDIDWAFSTRDIENLARLHKANRFRKKIEDLLEDCNFHKEAALMCSHQYDKLLNEEDADEYSWNKEKCCLTCGLRSICPHARHVFEAAMCGTDEQEFREFLLEAYRTDVCEHWQPVHEAGATKKNA